MKKSNWFVITGAPGAGKTTTINILQKKGYNTTHETAREYFESQIEKGLTSEQIRSDPQKLENNILKMQIDLEAKHSFEELLFLDIAVPDTFAYYKFHNIQIPQELQIDVRGRYNSIFFLETVSVIHDEVRKENEKEIKKIRQLIEEQYTNLGYIIIPIPFLPPEKRVDLILDYVKKYANSAS